MVLFFAASFSPLFSKLQRAISLPLGLVCLALSYASVSTTMVGLKNLEINTCFSETYKTSPHQVNKDDLKRYEDNLENANKAIALGKKFGVDNTNMNYELMMQTHATDSIKSWHMKNKDAKNYPKTTEFIVVGKTSDNELIYVSENKRLYSNGVIRLDRNHFKRVSCSDKIVKISKSYDSVSLNK